jgi:hypothetical protein
MNSIICEPYRQMCPYMCVDQREALAVTTRLTDTVCFGSPYRDSNWQPFTNKLFGTFRVGHKNSFSVKRFRLVNNV